MADGWTKWLSRIDVQKEEPKGFFWETAYRYPVEPVTPGAADAVFTSRVGRATVLTVGPENAFVVVNFGSARGAQVGQKMNLSQGTSVVATVLIRDVRTHFSVAHVVPESLRGALHKGDSAVLIR